MTEYGEEVTQWSHRDEDFWRDVSNIHYYLREGYYGTALLICDGTLHSAPPSSDNSTISMLKGVSLTLLGRIPEATRCLDQISSKNVQLGVLFARKWSHSAAFNPDNQSLLEIENMISVTNRDEKTPASSFAAAAEVLYFSGDYARAKQMMSVAQKRSTQRNAKDMCLLGWIELSLGRNQKSTQELFEKTAGQGYPDGYIGRCRVLELYHSGAEMKIVAKELTLTSYQFIPGHAERIKAALMMKEWANMADAINNSNLSEGANPLVDVLRCIHAICASGWTGGALATSLQSIEKSLNENEATNHRLMAFVATLLASISAGDRVILQFAKSLTSKAVQLSRKPEYLAVALRISMSLGEAKEVAGIANELVQMDCDEPYAALATVISMLMTGRLKDAKAQYDIIEAVHPRISESSVYHIIGGIISKHQSNNSNFSTFRPFIDEALERQRAQLQSFPFGIDYLYNFNSDLFYMTIEQIFDFAPIVPIKSADECLRCAEVIANQIVEVAPAMAHCSYRLALIKYLSSNCAEADKFVKQCLEKNETFTDGYVLKAQIILDRGGKITEAEHALTTGLNFNFALRDTSLYHLIKAKTLRKKNEMEEAVKLLKSAMRLPPKESSKNLLMPKAATDTHKISIQLELIDALQMMNRTEEAEQQMAEAMNEWSGKPEQEQLIISQAQLNVAKGNSDKAIDILSKVQPGQANYLLARVKMAEIYLEEKKDKWMFASCYRSLLNADPSPASYSILGDAFMSIQEPEEAIGYYEQALKMQNKDVLLAEKIGEAYVMAHLYTKAVNFYEASMNIYKEKRMRLKLADLLLKLKNFDKCERVLKQPLDAEPSPIDAETVQDHVQLLLLLSQVYQNKEQWNEAFDCLTKAKVYQQRANGKNDATLNLAIKKDVSKICCLVAELHLRRRDITKATEAYKDSLTFFENDLKSTLALANIYMQQNKLQLCNQMCLNVLSIERDNDEATLMMADLMYLKNEGEQAIMHFTSLLTRNPNHYHALSRVIELAWRSGDPETAEKYLLKALESNGRAVADAGYNYCKGLHEWFTGDPNSSLQAFNRARRDPEWGEKSIYNMIEICLNPDNEIIGGEVFDQNGSDEVDRAMGTKTAEKFLKELQYKSNVDSRYALMENFILVQTGNRNNINKALTAFLAMAGEGETVGNVGAILGAARSYMLLKQVPKAKAMLKRVIAHTWTIDNADYLEKCWLLLADTYINQNKFEQATKVVDLVLQHNASSIKAFEYHGYLKEKDQKFADAYKYYEKAWKISKQRNPAIGYKLAYNYLKCKRLFACIETCHAVLEQFPNYPKIKKEIMDKARVQIRT